LVCHAGLFTGLIALLVSFLSPYDGRFPALRGRTNVRSARFETCDGDHDYRPTVDLLCDTSLHLQAFQGNLVDPDDFPAPAKAPFGLISTAEYPVAAAAAGLPYAPAVLTPASADSSPPSSRGPPLS
jgi:hypothetical protein